MADLSEYLSNLVGAPVTISSGDRSPQKNRLVGGAPNSAHLSPGQAYDFVPKGISTADAVSRFSKAGIPFDQLIDEGDHVHVSFAPTNRKQVISKMAQDGPSDDDIMAAFMGKPPKVPQSPPTGPQDGPSDDQIMAAFVGGKSAPAATQQAPGKPGMLQSASAGVIQGGRDFVSSLDPIAQWLDKHVGSVTLGGLLPTANQAHASNLLAKGQFDQQYGDNTAAQVGRVGGEIAASLPALAAGGEVLGPMAAAAGRGGQFLSGAYKGNKLLQLASRGVSGALQGTAAAGLTSGASDQPISDQLRQGAEFGGVLNTALPAARMAGGALFNGLHGGGGVSQARAGLANTALNEFGIPLRGGQISTSPFAHFADSAIGKLPLSGIEASNEAQREAFSRAVAGTMGENANNLSPQVMSSARSRIGKVFEDVAARTTIQNAPAVLANIGNVIKDASQVLPEDSVKPLFKQLENIGSVVDAESKTISGQAYQALTRKGSPLDRAMNSSDPNIRHYSGQIKDALDDALESSASKSDLQELKTARLHWKNMRTIQDLAAKANIEGDISPTALLGAVKKSYKDMAFSGAGKIGTLANIGQTFLKETPNSTTAERGLLYSLLAGGAETLGEGLHDPSVILSRGALAAALLGTGKIAGSGLKSKLYRDAVLAGARQGDNTLNTVLGKRGLYAIPSTVIGGNRLLNRPDESAPP